ncbi:MAG: hypothetical protein LBQ09_08100 [Acidobacteriaceae bacterium]|nr:hypothetical protein [Acidobacteriaceae bacterium]
MTIFSKRYLFPAIVFLSIAIVQSFPLVFHLSTSLPGSGIGDNANAVWNFWWMRHALTNGANPLFTDYLFAPLGIDLTLNSHTALPAFIGALAFGQFGPIAAHNLTLLLTLAANGLAAYALAFSRTGHLRASIVAGVVFACSPYVAAHLQGHFNLVSAWTIPLVVMAALNALTRQSTSWALLTGALLGATAYTDYYYCTYLVVFLVVLALITTHSFTLVRARQTSRWPRWSTALLWIAGIAAAVAIAIASTGGTTLVLYGQRVSITSPTNILTVGWLAIVLWALARWRLAVQRTEQASPLLRPAVFGGAAFLVTVLPLAWCVYRLIAAGDYVAPEHQWKSGAAGVDVLSLVLPNPMNPLWGDLVHRLYARLALNPIEGVGWLGLAPLVLAALIVKRTFRSDREVRLWCAIGGVFLVWALGPWLHIAGVNTGLVLPQNLLSFVPIISNARIPGRAMVMVSLAVAMLCAKAVTDLPSMRSPRALVALGFSLALDLMVFPYPTVSAESPAIYQRLATRERGTVLELPLGLRDGFGAIGSSPDTAMLAQTVHEHPIMGGFVARLPPSVKAFYLDNPILRSLMDLPADARELPATNRSPEELVRELRRLGVNYVVLDTRRASAALHTYVTNAIGGHVLDKDDQRVVFTLDEVSPVERPSATP